MKKLLLSIILLPCLAQADFINTKKVDEYGRPLYKGQTTLTGKVTVDEYEWGPSTCFHVDKKDAYKIPRPKGDERGPWFCFSNEKTANKILKLPNTMKNGICSYKAKATITVKDYALFIEQTAGVDETTLISAKVITPYKAIKC